MAGQVFYSSFIILLYYTIVTLLLSWTLPGGALLEKKDDWRRKMRMGSSLFHLFHLWKNIYIIVFLFTFLLS